MREILGKRRRFTWPMRLLASMGLKTPKSKQEQERSALRTAALTCAEQWKWPVLPGVGHERPPSGRAALRTGPAATAESAGAADKATGAERTAVCCCPRSDCETPGAHPHDPGLLAATVDPRMVDWWWTRRPDVPLLVATGGTVSAVSLPAVAGMRAVSALEDLGVRLGPVIATPTRCVMLVAPYSLEELGELLARQDWVPSSLRYHGRGGYVVLPPSRVAGGGVCWAREPKPAADGGAPWLPEIGVIMDMLVAAGVSAPDGSRLAY